MKRTVILTTAYAVLVGVGGVIGYAQAGSQASLIMGSVSALLLCGSALLMQKNVAAGRLAALFLMAALAGFFSYRFVETQKFMPAGMMAVMSMFVLAGMFFGERRLGVVK